MMAFLSDYFSILLHLDTHLSLLVSHLGVWAYAILFLIIFLESGLILTPFLPGDSLLFATGSLAALGTLNVDILAITLSIAAILGGMVNYGLGYKIGAMLFPEGKVSPFSKYLTQAHQFYERHGGIAIILARLIPIIRTYAPFVAGLARMNFLLFNFYNALGGIIWICIFIYASYYFGQIPLIKQNFSLVILAIIMISILPGVIEVLRHKFKTYKNEY